MILALSRHRWWEKFKVRIVEHTLELRLYLLVHEFRFNTFIYNLECNFSYF
jgi:hypothetical protein